MREGGGGWGTGALQEKRASIETAAGEDPVATNSQPALRTIALPPDIALVPLWRSGQAESPPWT